MKKYRIKKIFPYFIVLIFVFLSGCSNYTGIKTPLYDGEPIKPNKEAIEAYREKAEVIGAEKEFYLRYPFSEDILQKSVDYPNEEPFLLEEGRYVIGEDLPAGRATLLGNESSFSTESYDVHVGNLVVRDEAGAIYFENLFHSAYGQLTAQFDLLAGHEITIIGKEAEITVFYEENLPEDPYILMDLPVLIQNLDRMDVQQPIEFFEKGSLVQLTAGIFEVGVHLEAGEYALSDLLAPHNTEMYIFDEESSPRVIELLLGMSGDSAVNQHLDDKSTVELEAGEKIYLNLVEKLELIRLEK